MNIRHCIFASAFLIAALTSHSTAMAEDIPDWMRIGTTENGTVLYARTADIAVGRPTTTAAKLWIKFDASKDRKVAWNTTLVLYTVNCLAETYRLVQGTTYFSDGTNSDLSNPDTSLKFVTPDTNMSVAVDLLCAAPSAPATDYR